MKFLIGIRVHSGVMDKGSTPFFRSCTPASAVHDRNGVSYYTDVIRSQDDLTICSYYTMLCVKNGSLMMQLLFTFLVLLINKTKHCNVNLHKTQAHMQCGMRSCTSTISLQIFVYIYIV